MSQNITENKVIKQKVNKFVQLTVQQMSQALFKVMVHSYCRYHEQGNLLRDTLSAISSQVRTIDSKVREEIKQIAEVLSLPSQATQHEMSVIMEQQTERSLGDHTGYQQWMGQLKDGFNVQIGKLSQMEGSVDRLVQIYKNQLLEMSKQMTKWQTKNQDMKKQIHKLCQEKQALYEENNQLKDQITMQAAQMFISQSDHDVESVFDQFAQKQKQKLRGKNDKEIKNNDDELYTNQFNKQIKTKNIEKNKGIQTYKHTMKNEDNHMKSNISREKSSIQMKRNKQEQENQTKLVEVRIHSQKDSQQQLQKWKKLSKKIDELKGKLILYEEEISEKDTMIKKLANQLKEYKQQGQADSQQRRKIKTVNTTLRGQKTVLQNQVNSIRKLLAQKTQLCNVQQIQIQQLKVQIQNFNQTIKWQNSTIDDLRSTITKSQNRTNEESKLKIEHLTKINQQFVSVLNRQQTQLQQINAVTFQIEQLYNAKINVMVGKIAQMEMILDEKNDFIIKMKTKNYGNLGGYASENINPNTQNHNQAYLNELVRVLTKKVADRDQIIRRLQSSK